MAASEKRRPPPPAATTGREPSRPVATATGNGSPEGAAEFLLQARATDLVREALLKVLEARPEEPVDFLAGYFQQLMQHRSPAAAAAEEEEAASSFSSSSSGGETPRQQQHRLERALGCLGLAHHSHRTAFNNNVSAAYEALSAAGWRKRRGVNGKLYSDLLRMMFREQGTAEDLAQPLLGKILCRDHEAVPYDVFRYGVLTALVLLEFLGKADALYDALGGDSGSADIRVCLATLGTLEEALRDAGISAPIRYLEAGSKLGPDSLALAMDNALREREPSVTMKKEEFLKRASSVFVAKVKPVD